MLLAVGGFLLLVVSGRWWFLAVGGVGGFLWYRETVGLALR